MEKLENLATVTAGHPFRGAIRPVEEGNGLVVQMKDVGVDQNVEWDRLVRTLVKGRKQPDWLQKDDIIFLARGNNNFAIWLPEVPVKAVCSPHFFVIRVHDERFLPAFVAWQLNQEPAQRHFNVTAAESSQRSIPIRELKSIELIHLSIEQQANIVALQSGYAREKAAYLRLIDNRQRELKAIAQHFLKGSYGERCSTRG
ncbi:MAG: restriction endonuclease subunit S [Thiogranum sp.]|nr:restriction endonuclease subunit S [Thiogranum sp.]